MRRCFVCVVFVCVALLAVTLVKGSLPTVESGTWRAMDPLQQGRAGAAATLLADGRVLVTGGSDGTSPLASTEVFGVGGSCSAAAPMNTARIRHTAVALSDGRVLVAGGD